MSVPSGTRPTADEIAAQLRPMAIGFSTMLVLLVPLSYLVLVPHPTIGTTGVGTGVLLAVVAWVAPRLVAGWNLGAAARRGVPPEAEAGVVRTVAIMAAAFAETPGLASLALAASGFVDAGVMAPAMLVSAVSVWFNACGPSAVRRHLDRLRG